METERRSQSRLLCADLVDVEWLESHGRRRHCTALLEDISAHGACLQFEMPFPSGTAVQINCSGKHLNAKVCYCVYREIGYFVGVEFASGSQWSPEQFKPQHLLDVRTLQTARTRKSSRRVN